MLIDGVAASEAIDSSGEVLDVEGCDISSLEEGHGVLNWEHRGEDAPGASPADIVGKIAYAKKVFKRSDCENERQRMYWDKVKLPYIYIIARLFDGSGHHGAQELAAIIRDYKINGEPILVRYSIEGSTLEKEGNNLKRSVARRVAATIKPCNRSCHSDVLEDPNSPNGKKKYESEPKDVLEDVQNKSETLPHPNYTRLGGSCEVECDPEMNDELALAKAMLKLKLLRKAISAGTTDAAPGSLVGGAALQKEHLKGTVMAAIRDFGKPFSKTKFKEFLKTLLPETSDEFVDHFADLADDYHVKLRKGEAAVKIPDDEEVRSPVDTEGEPAAHMGVSEPATVRGKPIKPNPQLTSPVFNEKQGILHTPAGSFRMYNPSQDPQGADSFHNLMNDPKLSKFHDEAMGNWVKVHKLLKAGKLPPEVVMHGTLFSMLSPNTPVPMQELMYARLVDAMKHTGHDPRKPGFENIYDHWKGLDQPDVLPEHSRESFANHPGVHLKSPSKFNGRQPGDIGAFMIPNDKMKNMAKYHLVHDSLVDLMNRHRADGRTAVAELMDQKRKKLNWDNGRRAKLKSGLDVGPYKGPLVPGLATKTARYTYGMMGGGNVVVPDTHMSRYLFGLDKAKDANTIAYLRNTLWRNTNSHIMGGIDRWYAKNHPAVEHMVHHPEWGKYFENREDAIFPAFWKNWNVINPHERTRGMRTGAFNEGTTHRPFWEAIDPFLNVAKSEVDLDMPFRTARQHQAWVKEYGEVPAMMLYYRHLAPKLLESAQTREHVGYTKSVRSLESLYIDLRKAIDNVVNPRAKLREVMEGPTRSGIIDSAVHVPQHLVKKPEQNDLVHGSDITKWESSKNRPGHAKSGMTEHHGGSQWVKTASGKTAIAKELSAGHTHGIDPAIAEVAYHNMAHDFFGLGKYVPTTTAFKSPFSGNMVSVQEAVPNASHMNVDYDDENNRTVDPESLGKLRKVGTNDIHKLSIMNWAMGNVDRHEGNFVFTDKEPHLHLIDHGYSFHPSASEYMAYPDYAAHHAQFNHLNHAGEDHVDPEVVHWLRGLDRQAFRQKLLDHGIPKQQVMEAFLRLEGMENATRVPDGDHNTTLGKLFQGARTY